MLRSRKLRAAAAVVAPAAALAMLGTATPARADVQVRGISTFYEHSGHRGAGTERSGSGGRCYNLEPAWQNRISSIFGSSRVHLYSRANCWFDTGIPHQEYNGGTTYVGDVMNDRTVSYRIW
jgi:hypothetical protein